MADRNVDNAVLIGHRGSGKTTVGHLLAGHLGWRFVDTDVLIVERAGRSIAEIFAHDGEATFRDIERQVIAEQAGVIRTVLSVGGGAVEDPQNCRILGQLGFVIWLMADADTLVSRIQADPQSADSRPPLSTDDLHADIRRKLLSREPRYTALADWHLDTVAQEPHSLAAAIAHRLRELGPLQGRR